MSWSIVTPGLPGPPCGNMVTPAQTLGNIVFVEHNNKRRILENKKAFKIERSKQEQNRIERQNLGDKWMRDLMKARHKLEELEHQHRMAKMEEELQELRNQLSKLKMQQSSPLPPTTVHAPISRKPINSLSYPNIKPPTTVHAPISRKPINSLSYPNIKPPTTVHPLISRKPINLLSYPNFKPPTTVHTPISRKQINSLSYPNIKRNCISNLREKVLPRNNEHRSSTEMDDGIRAEELPKETISKSCFKENFLRAKVLPRNNEHKRSTEMNDGIRAEEVPKDTVSKSYIKRNRSDEVIISKVDKAKVISKPNLGFIVEKQNVTKYLSCFISYRWPYLIKDVFDVNKDSFLIFHRWRHKYSTFIKY